MSENGEDRIQAAVGKGLRNLSSEELLALKDELNAGGVRIYNSLTPEMLALLGASAIYSKAFLETLAKHHADAVAEQVRQRLRKNGAATEVQGGAQGEAGRELNPRTR